MEAILNQTEIEGLLAAIKSGEVTMTSEEQQEQERLDGAADSISLFKLTHGDRDAARVPNFDIIVDSFARDFATTLTNQLQRTFTLHRLELDTMEYQEFLSKRSNSGAIGIFEMPPLPTGCLLMFDAHLSFSILEIMLGAAMDIESPPMDRRLTTLEVNIIKGIIGNVSGDLNKAFSPMLECHSAILKLENNTRMVSLCEPEAEVEVATLQVKIREEIGRIYMLFPLTTLDPLRPQLKELLKIHTQRASNWKEIFSNHLREIPLQVTARSGLLNMNVRQILELKAGDIIPLNYDPNNPLEVLVEENQKFTAVPGTHNGNKAISILSTV
jgi:flagellar motor switch protein FliM